MDNKHMLIQRAQLIANKNVQDNTYPKSSLVQIYITRDTKELINDKWIAAFISDAIETILGKQWDNEKEIIEKLPPRGFRSEKETRKWAGWFTSHKSRTLSVNRFIQLCKTISTAQSVYDLMYETFRSEQQRVAASVLEYLKNDDNF